VAVCLDEIFFNGRPVLVGVEPGSMAWFLGQKASSLTGSTWAESLQAWDALQHVVADAGRLLQAGILPTVLAKLGVTALELSSKGENDLM
jgi:hypothetical protein